MKPRINIKTVWLDEDIIEFEITCCNGKSQFSVTAYESKSHHASLLSELKEYQKAIYGKITAFELGTFGEQYANGAIRVTMHCQKKGHIYISVAMESGYFIFGKEEVAERAEMYIISEPELFDRFIKEFETVIQDVGREATIDCLYINEVE